MTSVGGLLRLPLYRNASLAIAAAIVLILVNAMGARSAYAATVQGTVESNGTGLTNYQVSLYAALPGGAPGSNWILLGNTTTDSSGAFSITYTTPTVPPGAAQPLLFVEAVDGQAMLASAIGGAQNVVVNERTTVATANAFAQFIQGSVIAGNTYGMINAVHMVANLVDPVSGDVGVRLTSSPNGTLTSTLATFNSLANVVSSCVAAQSNCLQLFQITTPSGGTAPANVLQALANVVKNPSFLQSDGTQAPSDPLFALSQTRQVYSPFLSQRPTNWLLFFKITGGFYNAQTATNLMNGPANFAFDARGYAWVPENYTPAPSIHFACASQRVVKFFPWGENFPGSPYYGGGLSGQGYGVAFDPRGNIWISNFGFQDEECVGYPIAAPSNSVSLFRPNGKPLSPGNGFTQGDISWPQGAVSDRLGNIFVANCGNDSVTEIPGGNPNRAFNIPLGPSPAPGVPQIKPFGIAIDLDGNAWVTNNYNNTISIISPKGTLLATVPGVYQGNTVLTHPVGNAVDSKGDVWVSNSDWLDVPCPTKTNVGAAAHPSITLYQRGSRVPYGGAAFTGGGLTIPWGIAVDGNDTVWAFNFGVVPVGQTTETPTGISHFCGIDPSKCPAGLSVGSPISPNDTGYRSDALERITGGQIDPSGNIWMTGNWKIDANPNMNPGGNSIAIAIGAAAPIRTPLIGPPIPFN